MFRKKLASLALAAVLTFGTTTGVFAAEENNNINIQLNGSNITFNDTKPIFQNNSSYAPFKEIFEALGASVSYDETAKTYTAKKDSTTITYKDGDSILTIEKDGKSESKDFEAPAGYIPARIAAEIFDYTAGWDSSNKTVIIADKNALLSKLGDYTVMDKYLAYCNEFSSKPLALKGTFDFNYEVNAGENKLPITGTGTIDGITDSEKLNMEMAMKFDISKLAELNGELSEEKLQQANDMFGDIKMNFIVDLSTGKYYINSPLLAKMTVGNTATENTWLMIDLNDMLKQTGNSNFSFKDIAEMSKSANFKTYMQAILNSVPYTSINDYKSMEQFVDTMNQLFSDTAFKKEGNTYQSNYNITEDSTTVSLGMTLTEENDKVTGYSFDMTVSDPTANMKIKAAQNGNIVTTNMSFSMASLLNMVMNMNMEYSDTSETPVSAPSSDNIISFTEILNNNK